jgi:hypothetical protein
VVGEDAGLPLPLLDQGNDAVWDDLLNTPERPEDHDWIKAHKRAIRTLGMNESNFGELEGELGQAISNALVDMGYDAAYTKSGGEEWVTLLTEPGQWLQRGTRSAEGGERLYSQITDAITRDANLAEIPTEEFKRMAEKWQDIMPAFMGNKRKMAAHAAQNIRAVFTDEERGKFDTLVDYFGGGGSWGLHLALTHFPNVKRLIVHEYEPERLAKIRYFHERGNRLNEDYEASAVKAAMEDAWKQAEKDGKPSPAAILNRLELIENATEQDEAIAKAFYDQATNDRASGRDDEGNRQAELSLRNMLNGIIEDAANTHRGAAQARNRGVQFEYEPGDSYKSEIIAGSNVMSITDPPYYKTSAYQGARLVPFSVYVQTGQLMKRLRKAENGIIYTDSAWWIDGNEDRDQQPDMFMPPGFQSELEVLTNTLENVPNYGIIQITPTRHELLAIHNPARATRSEQSSRRLPHSSRAAERGTDTGRVSANDAPTVGAVESRAKSPVSVGKRDSGRATQSSESTLFGSTTVTPQAAPAPAAPTPPPAPVKQSNFDYDAIRAVNTLIGKAIVETRLTNEAQQDDQGPLKSQDTGKPKPIGDHRLAHSMDNEMWMGMDEFRKQNYQAQKEAEWIAAAQFAIDTDYDTALNGMMAKALEGEFFTPTETHMVNMLIERESAKERTVERHMRILALMYGYRKSRSETARTMRAGRDPLRGPAERARAYFARKIYEPNDSVTAKIDKAPSEATKAKRIATLEAQLREAMAAQNLGQQKRAEQELKDAQAVQSKEDIQQQDYNTRVKPILDKLASMGITEADLMGDVVELRLRGAKIIGEVAKNYTPEERRALRAAQETLGNMSNEALAARLKLPIADLQSIMNRFNRDLENALADRFQRGITLDELEIAKATEEILSSNPEMQPRKQISREDALKMAGQARRMMGFFDPAERNKVRTKKVKKGDVHRVGGRTVLGKPPMGRPAVGARLPLPSDPKTPFDNPDYTGAAGADDMFDGGRIPGRSTDDILIALKLDLTKDTDVIHAARAIDQASGATWVDYTNELFINNLVSAPITGVTNLTGYGYAFYDLTMGRALEASINALTYKDPASAQFGELKWVMKGMRKGMKNAIQNAVDSWQTESPVFEQRALDTQHEFSATFLDNYQGGGSISDAKGGRIIRIPTRALLMVDEFMRTLIGHAHATTVAYRAAKARGLDKQALENYISSQLLQPGSIAWQEATREASRLAFQESLRSWKQIKNESKQEGTPINFANFVFEGALKQLQDLKQMKSDDLQDQKVARFSMQIAQLFASLMMPFVRTPYRLLSIGLQHTIPGALVDEGATSKAEPRDRVRAHAHTASAAILTLMILGAGEGDEDDDDKFILITGSRAPEGKEATRGAREFANRTIPGQTIRIGGKDGIMISYERMDPFSTAIATTVDQMKAIKETSRGKSYSDASKAIAVSLYNQLLSKSMLQSLGELDALIFGRGDMAQFATDKALAIAVPNVVRNIARNSDPLVRNARDMPMGLDYLKYQALPIAPFAPPPRIDIAGREVEKRGNVVTRALLPGNAGVRPQDALALDTFLKRYHFHNPSDKFAPSTPSNKYNKGTGEREMTPEQYERFLRLRGRLFMQNLNESGILGRVYPNERDKAALQSAATKATIAAKKQLFGVDAD